MFHTSLATWWSSASTIPMIRRSWPLNWCAKLQTLCIYKTKGKANSFFQMQLHSLMIFYQIWLSWHCATMQNCFAYFGTLPRNKESTTLVPTKPETNRPLGSLSMTRVRLYYLRKKKKGQSATRVIGACSTIDISPYIPVLVEHECNKMEGCSSSSWFLLYF